MTDISDLDIDLDEIDTENYTFVITPDGSLKYMVIPEDLIDEPPEEVKMILEIFGIKDTYTLEGRTLH